MIFLKAPVVTTYIYIYILSIYCYKNTKLPNIMCDQHTGREHFNYSSNIIKKTSHIGIIDKNPRVHTGELNKYIITVAYHEHHERPSI